MEATRDDGWVSPSVWGPTAWDHYYHVAAGYDLSRRDMYQAYFELVPFVQRCDECNMNAQFVWARRPVSGYLGSREKLLEWVWLQHMGVRRHQKVRTIPDFPLSDVYQRYLPPDTEGAALPAAQMSGVSASPHGSQPVAPPPADSPSKAAIAIFATARTHLHSSYNGGGPVPATSFTPVATPTNYPASAPASSAAIALFAYNASTQQPSMGTRITAQSVDGHVREQNQISAAGFKGVPAKAVGFSRCCKNRVQASAAATQAFAV